MRRPVPAHKLNVWTRLSRGSFTLIELLVVVGVTALLATLATDIFLSVTRSYNKAQVITAIERAGSTALSTMSNEIRNAQSVSPASGNSATLNIVDKDGVAVAFAFVAPTTVANGYISRNGSSITNNDFTSGVNVTIGMFTVADSDPPVVKITVTVAQAKGIPSRVDYQAAVTMSTTVSLRY